jgi:cellobiose-specific phosphotransferase system component IIA
MNLENSALLIISSAGEAKSMVYEGLDCLLEDDLENAKQKFERAKQLIAEAHRANTIIIQTEAKNPGDVQPTILYIHAMDILLTTITELDLANNFFLKYYCKQKGQLFQSAK